MIFERYGKVKKRVGSQLAINHKLKLDITKHTILMPVTATRDYNFVAPTSNPVPVRPSDPDKQAFNKMLDFTPEGNRQKLLVKKSATSKSCATVVKIPGVSTSAPSCQHSKGSAPQNPIAARCSKVSVGPASLLAL